MKNKSIFKILTLDFVSDLINSNSINELNELLSKQLSTEYCTIDSVLIDVTLDKKNEALYFNSLMTESALPSRIDYLMEEGIIDWAILSREPQLIMDLQSQLKGAELNILLIPLIFNEIPYGVSVSFTEKKKEDFDENSINELKRFAEIVANKMKSINDEDKIPKLELRLDEINKRFMQALPMTAFGEISLNVLKEATMPLQIIESNIDLIGSGVGNLNRRLEIIKQQTKSLTEIIQLIAEVSEDSYKSEPEHINANEFMDAIRNITSSQLKSRGMKLDVDIENSNVGIYAIKTQLEYAIIHLIQYFLAAELESESIFVSVNIHNPRTVLIALKDENSIFDVDNYDKFTEAVKLVAPLERLVSGFYSVKNIIKNSDGKIDCSSKAGFGTIFRIYLPISNDILKNKDLII